MNNSDCRGHGTSTTRMRNLNHACHHRLWILNRVGSSKKLDDKLFVHIANRSPENRTNRDLRPQTVNQMIGVQCVIAIVE